MRGTLNLPGTFWCVVSGGRLPMSAPTFKGGNVHCCAGRLTTSCLTKGLWMWSGGPGSQVPLIWKFLYIQCTMYMLCILMIDEIANADCRYHWPQSTPTRLYPVFSSVSLIWICALHEIQICSLMYNRYYSHIFISVDNANNCFT